MDDIPNQPRSFGRLLRNWLSWAGLVLCVSAVFAFIFLLAIDLFAGHQNPYVGILAYVIAPGFFLLGLFLAALGVFIRWRAQRRAGVAAPLVFRVDLSNKSGRRLLIAFGAASAVFLLITALASYGTYQVTESDQFCGQACHVPMEPQFVAAHHTPHARVGCVGCHVPPGATGYFKTKVNGVKQLYHAVRDDFDRPIYAGKARPAQEICMECHWPDRFIGNIVRSYQHYLSDETNTPFTVRLLLNVGGADPSHGPQGGIHWHMNIANKVEYVAADEHATAIPWVRVTNAQGQTTEYRTAEFQENPAPQQIRRMDCMDCHSRPAHNLQAPNDAVDIAMATGRIDPSIPNAKAKVVDALVQPYKTKPEALQAIATKLRADYPDAAQANRLVEETQAIYRDNFFPEMNTDWRTHPNNVGHKNFDGCFRCHDGNHKTADGQKMIAATDCRSCHLIVAQGSGDQLKELNAEGLPFFHIDSEYSDFTCTTCHTGGPQKP